MEDVEHARIQHGRGKEEKKGAALHTGKLAEIDARVYMLLQIFEDVLCLLDAFSSVADTLKRWREREKEETNVQVSWCELEDGDVDQGCVCKTG